MKEIDGLIRLSLVGRQVDFTVCNSTFFLYKPVVLPKPGEYEFDFRGMFRSGPEDKVPAGWRVATAGEVLEACQVIMEAGLPNPLSFIHWAEKVEGYEYRGYGYRVSTENTLTLFFVGTQPCIHQVSHDGSRGDLNTCLPHPSDWRASFLRHHLKSVLVREL